MIIAQSGLFLSRVWKTDCKYLPRFVYKARPCVEFIGENIVTDKHEGEQKGLAQGSPCVHSCELPGVWILNTDQAIKGGYEQRQNALLPCHYKLSLLSCQDHRPLKIINCLLTKIGGKSVAFVEVIVSGLHPQGCEVNLILRERQCQSSEPIFGT